MEDTEVATPVGMEIAKTMKVDTQVCRISTLAAAITQEGAVKATTAEEAMARVIIVKALTTTISTRTKVIRVTAAVSEDSREASITEKMEDKAVITGTREADEDAPRFKPRGDEDTTAVDKYTGGHQSGYGGKTFNCYNCKMVFPCYSELFAHKELAHGITWTKKLRGETEDTYRVNPSEAASTASTRDEKPPSHPIPPEQMGFGTDDLPNA